MLATLLIRTWSTWPDTHKTPADPNQSWITIVSPIVLGLVEPDDPRVT